MGYDVYIIHDDDKGWIKRFPSMKEEYNDIYYYPLKPGERKVFHTGVKISTPDDYGFLLRDRSGLAVKEGLHILAGVIEGTYRGEWMVCAINLGEHDIIIRSGDKIAQAVLTKVIPSGTIKVENLEETERGEKGFGSSGR